MTATASSCATRCGMRMARRMCTTRWRKAAWSSCSSRPRRRATRRASRCRGLSSSRESLADMALVDIAPKDALLPDVFRRGFASRGWTPRAHQLELLAKAEQGHSVLLIAPTGGGKTLAGFLPSLVELTEQNSNRGDSKKLVSTGRGIRREGGLHTLYISPLKALAVDIARNLEKPVAEMQLLLRIETRTGDTPTSKRQRQRRDPPDILLTTPEQLALLLATADAPFLFGSLKRVILDELHSLVLSKRGDLLSLGLARLFTIAPRLVTVGLSATVAEPDALCRFLVPQPPA